MATVTHKTFGGMRRAVERLICDLASGINDAEEEAAYSARCDALCRELNALWSNPADVSEAAALKSRLVAAWNKAMG